VKIRERELLTAGEVAGRLGDFLGEHAGEISYHGNLGADDAVSGVSYDRSRAAPGHSDPVGGRFATTFQRRSPRGPEEAFVRNVRELVRLACEVERQGRGFLPLSEKQAAALLKGGTIALKAGEADKYLPMCANPACRVDVLERPKAGRCPACYEYRRRTGNERPRHLCHPEDQAEAM